MRLRAAFSEHLRETDSELGLRDALASQTPGARWFVPPFVIRRNMASIGQALLDARLDQDREQMFPWGYLREKLDLW